MAYQDGFTLAAAKFGRLVTIDVNLGKSSVSKVLKKALGESASAGAALLGAVNIRYGF